jgi:hypothetical protein
VPPVINVEARGRFSIAARRFVPAAGVIRAVRFCGVFVGMKEMVLAACLRRLPNGDA